MSEDQIPYRQRLALIRQGLAEKTTGAKPRKAIAKVSEKKKKEIEAEKERLGGNDSELVRWYKSKMKQMYGVCSETGLKTETKIYAYAIMSICHILPKATVKSLATHPFNWIELNCDFHKKFDAMSWEEREKLGCWPNIFQRLLLMYEHCDPSEKRHFPESVHKFFESKTNT